VDTAKAERMPMVEFELVALLAPSTPLVHVAASAAVAFIHGTADGRRDVARGGRRECPSLVRLHRALVPEWAT
jgi:hypothetical protein